MHILEVLKLAWSEMTWSEGRSFMQESMASFLSFTMSSFHGLEAVPSTKEAFNLRIVVIVMHWLNKFWMSVLKLLVMELIWHTAMVGMQLSCWNFGLCDRFALFEVHLHIFSINILVNVRISWNSTRLVNGWTLFFEAFHRSLNHSLRAYLLFLSLYLLAWSYWFNRGTQSARMTEAILHRFIFLWSALIGLLGRISFLAVILISRDSRLELERDCLGLSRLALIHILVISNLGLAQDQVFEIVLLTGNVEGKVQIISEMLEVIKEPARMVTVWVMLQRQQLIGHLLVTRAPDAGRLLGLFWHFRNQVIAQSIGLSASTCSRGARRARTA